MSESLVRHLLEAGIIYFTRVQDRTYTDDRLTTLVVFCMERWEGKSHGLTTEFNYQRQNVEGQAPTRASGFTLEVGL